MMFDELHLRRSLRSLKVEKSENTPSSEPDISYAVVRCTDDYSLFAEQRNSRIFPPLLYTFQSRKAVKQFSFRI